MYKRRTLILYLAVVVALLPILIWRDFASSNELRYLSIADEALHNHTFLPFIIMELLIPISPHSTCGL